MAATDFLTTVYDTIWTKLEAHTPFTSTFKAANRIKTSGTSRDPFKTALGDADTPQITLFQESFTDSIFTTTRNFAYTTSFNPLTQPWVEEFQANYLLRILHRDLQLAVANLAVAEILTALRKGGPRWGLAYVASWGPSPITHRIVTDGGDEQSDGSRRLVTEIPLPVVLQFTSPQTQLTS